jgi:hypothetical protein
VRVILMMKKNPHEDECQQDGIIGSPQHMMSQGDAQSQSSTTATSRPHSLHENLEPLPTAFFAFLLTGFFDFLFIGKNPLSS